MSPALQIPFFEHNHLSIKGSVLFYCKGFFLGVNKDSNLKTPSKKGNNQMKIFIMQVNYIEECRNR